MEWLRRLRLASTPIVLAFLATFLMDTTTGGAGPSTEPLLHQGDLSYAGAFLLPDGTFGASDFHFSEFGAAYNPVNNSLYLTGNSTKQMTAEIRIPTPSPSLRLTDLPIATVLQTFVDASEGRMSPLGSDVKVGGYLIAGGRLVFDGYDYYDGSGSQRQSHFSRSLNLSAAGQVQGPFSMVLAQTRGIYTAGSNFTGGMSGPMTAIPAEWQPLLGGPAMTEQCCIPVPSRTSFGPGFFVFDPATLGAATPANMLLFYDQTHPLGEYAQQGPYFNGSTQIHGVVFPQGTRSVLYIGRQGQGPFCYGEGVTSNPPNPPVSNQLSGTNAWTSATGTVVAIPNVDVAAWVGAEIWLNAASGQTVAQIVGSANSGSPNASVTVTPALTPNLANQPFQIGMTNCYDPTDSTKGTHSFPYISQIWAYDANDLVAVKQGQKLPWEPRPYATWALSPEPFFNATGLVNAATYDPATRRLFVMQPYAYGEWGDLPAVYVYNVKSGLGAPPTNLRITR